MRTYIYLVTAWSGDEYDSEHCNVGVYETRTKAEKAIVDLKADDEEYGNDIDSTYEIEVWEVE